MTHIIGVLRKKTLTKSTSGICKLLLIDLDNDKSRQLHLHFKGAAIPLAPTTFNHYIENKKKAGINIEPLQDLQIYCFTSMSTGSLK